MSGRKKTEKERTAEIFAPFHEAARRLEAAAKSGAWDAKPRLRKVTEFFGFAYDDHDGPQFVRVDPTHGLHAGHLRAAELAPIGAVSTDLAPERRVRGHWRITMEFEPGEER